MSSSIYYYKATSFNFLVGYLPNSSLLSPPSTGVNTASLGPHEGLAQQRCCHLCSGEGSHEASHHFLNCSSAGQRIVKEGHRRAFASGHRTAGRGAARQLAMASLSLFLFFHSLAIFWFETGLTGAT